MIKSNHLKLTFAEFKEWLASDAAFEVPKGDLKQKELNLMMAVIVLIKIFNDNPRRVSDDFGKDLDALTAALDNFDTNAAKVLSMKVMRHAKKAGEKLCPIPMDTLKVLLFALADLGLVRPPKDSNAEVITAQILNCRAILYSFGSKLGKKIEEKENPKPSDQPPSTPESPSSAKE